MGGGGNTNTVQKSDPWSGQQPYLSYGFQQAQNNYQNHAPQYYPGSTVADFTPDQQSAMSLMEQRAVNGSPVMNATKQNLADTMNGAYLNSNPYMDGAYNAAANSVVRNYQNAVQPGISSGFEGAGRYGSGLAQNAQSQAQQDLGKSLGDMASTMYGNNYANERMNQMRAATFAPQIANNDYTDIAALNQVGADQQGQNQAQLSDSVNRWNFNQNLPNQMLGQYMGLINGNFGGTTQTQSPYFTNPLAQGLGLGLGGMSLYNQGAQAGLWGGAGAAGLGGMMAGYGWAPLAAGATDAAMMGTAAAAGDGIASLAPLAFAAM